jgi:hypothetical protein
MDADVMTAIGKPERVTQKRLIALFREELRYRYLGNRSDYPDNSNIEEKLLSAYLTQAGYSIEQIKRAMSGASSGFGWAQLSGGGGGRSPQLSLA